jgi:hypothetical protein
MIDLKTTRAFRAQGGFALVVTLSLMILLTVVAVGLLTLSSVSLRSASQGEAAAAARGNARLALMMAISELQREMGPDSRISAPHDAGSAASGGQAHWTAVYDAWQSTPGSPENPASRDLRFRGWLASGANQATGGQPGTTERALLVGANSLGAGATAADQVRVPMHEVNTGRQRGRIAWWTADEAAKAKVNAGSNASSALASSAPNPLFDTQSPANINQRAIPKLNGFDWKDGQRAKTISTAQVNLAAGLAGPAGVGSISHDLTVSSAGVLADVRAGRLKRDLSNLLARPVTELADKPLYLSDGRMNRFQITPDGAISNQNIVRPWSSVQNSSSEWGINLEELHLFHSLPRQLVWSGGSPRLVVKNTREQVVRDRHYLYSRPMVDVVQFILSLKAIPSTPAGTYKMEMMLDGVVALSNPNDVPIQWPAGLILPVQLQNIPYNITWEIKDASGNVKNRRTASSPNFGLFVGRVGGGSRAAAAGFTLPPGESVTFGSTSASGADLDLFPGFDPSGGVRMTGWNLNADQLRPTDTIDFKIERDTTPGFNGHYTYYNAWVGDRKGSRGWQTDTATLSSGGNLSSVRMSEFLPSPITPSEVLPVTKFLEPKPILMISFLRNVEKSSSAAPVDAFASRPFQLNEPAASGRRLSPEIIETGGALHATQQLITAEPMNYEFRSLAGGEGGRNVYHGGSRSLGIGGSLKVIKRRIPMAPPISLGAFQNAIASGFCGRFSDTPNISVGGDPFPTDALALSGHRYGWPLTAKAIGNSWSNPFVDSDKIHKPSSGESPVQKAATDHSWMVNTALWDSWFLSGIVDGSGAGSSAWMKDSRSPRAQFDDLVKNKGLLRNKRLMFHPHKSPEAALAELFNGNVFKPLALNHLAKYLLIDGAFNVNSTSVNAWAALLSSVRDQELLTAGGATKQFDHPFGTLGYAFNSATSGNDGDWTGLRSLSSSDIENLATAIVAEVKSRGPFLSMADFVNRRPNSSDQGQQALGALQAAIDKSGLNSRFTGLRSVSAADFAGLPGGPGIGNEPTPARAVGSPGHLSQGDLLTAIGSQISVRSDTFLVRTYGDARDASGKVLARAWCEAVIQRLPEYVDPTDSPEAQDGWPQAASKLTPANSLFGRRMVIQSFRWMGSNEI